MSARLVPRAGSHREPRSAPVWGDQRGAVLLEALLAFVPVFALFGAVLSGIDAYAHALIVQHAAVAAVRAAVVVLPDDGAHYHDRANRGLHRFAGERRAAIEDAARAVLKSSPDLRATAVDVTGSFAPGGSATAEVAAEYRCFLGTLGLVCGADRVMRLRARASLAYQHAGYRYRSGG